MIFIYNQLPKNFEKIYRINDLIKVDNSYFLVRESCFINLLTDQKVFIFSIPFWQENSQFWELKKIYSFNENYFILVSNIKGNCLKLFILKSINPPILQEISQINEELINLYQNYVLTKENIYMVNEKGFILLDLHNKLEYYNEIKLIDVDLTRQLNLLKLNNVFIPLAGLNKINSLLKSFSNLNKIRIMDLQNLEVFEFTLQDYIKDYSTEEVKKILVVFKKNFVELLAFSIDKSFSLKIDNNQNVYLRELNMNKKLVSDILTSDYVSVDEVDQNFLFLVYKDRYNMFDNELYFTRQDKFYSISKNNHFVKLIQDKLIILKDGFTLLEVDINEPEKSAIKNFYFTNDESVFLHYNNYNNRKRALISEFIDNLDLIDFVFEDGKFVFYFNSNYAIFCVSVSIDGKREVRILDPKNISISKYQKELLIDEDLHISLDLEQIKNIIMLKRINDDVLMVFKSINQINLGLINKNVIINLFNILDCYFDDNFKIFIDGNNLFFIQNDSLLLTTFPNELRRIKEFKNNVFFILDEMNRLYILRLLINGGSRLKVENLGIFEDLKGDFIILSNKIISFDQKDSLLILYYQNRQYLRSKLCLIPTSSILFFRHKEKNYVLIDEDVSFYFKEVSFNVE